MARTDDIDLGQFLIKSRAIEAWARAVDLDSAGADQVWSSAAWTVQELQESGIEPAAAMHVAQVLFMLVATSCRIEKETVKHFWNTFAEQAYDAAREFAESCPRAGETVSSGTRFDAH